jgi:hypothetical protein
MVMSGGTAPSILPYQMEIMVGDLHYERKSA